MATVVAAPYLRGVFGRAERSEQRLATLALSGGLLGTAFLLLSALLYRTLTRADGRATAAPRTPCSSSLTSPDRRQRSHLRRSVGPASLLTLEDRRSSQVDRPTRSRRRSARLASVVPLLWDLAFHLLLEPEGALSFLWLFAISLALVRETRADDPHAHLGQLTSGRSE